MSSVKDALDALCSIDGVNYAAFVDSDGFPIESVGKEPEHLPMPGSLMLNIRNLCSHLGGHFSLDTMSQSYIEFESFNFTGVPVGDFFLCVIARAGVNLGRIRLEIKKNRKILESSVS